MSTGRHTKPLFELLRDESSTARRAPVRAPAPTFTPEIKPTRTASPADLRADQPAPGPPASPDSALSIRDGVVSLSVYGAYLVLAGVLALTVLVWVFAYNSGRRAAERDFAARLSTDLPLGVTDPRALLDAPRDPLQDAGPRQDAKAAPGSQAQNPRQNPRQSPPPRPAGAVPGDLSVTDVITGTGVVASDPRTPGLNYQVLAYAVPRDEARDMVAFLSKNGTDTIAVPVKVDRKGVPDNNSPLYKVVVTQGLTSDQYSGNDPLRARQESEIRRLGPLWKQTKRGRTDLSSTYWELLKS